MINFLPGVTVSTGQVGPADERRDELWVAPVNTTVSTLIIHVTRDIPATTGEPKNHMLYCADTTFTFPPLSYPHHLVAALEG